MTPTSRTFTRPLLAVSAAALLALGGCKSKPDTKCDDASALAQTAVNPNHPVLAMASQMADTGDAYLIVEDLDAVLENARVVTQAGDDAAHAKWQPVLAMWQEAFKFSPIEREGWAETGLVMDSPIIFSASEADFVMAARVATPAKFEAWLEKAAGATFAPHEKLAETKSMHGGEISLRYSGDVAFLAIDDAPELLSTCHGCSNIGGPTLAESPGFQRFTTQVMEGAPVGVFIPPRGAFFEELAEDGFYDIAKSAYGRSRLDESEALRWIASVTGLGASFALTEEGMVSRGWIGLDRDGAARLSKLLTPADHLDKSFIGEDTMGFVHFSGDPNVLWDELVRLLSPRGRVRAEKNLLEFEEDKGFALNPGEDIFDRFGGHVLVTAWTGSGEAPTQPLDLGPVSVLALATFDSAEDAKGALDLLERTFDDDIQKRHREAGAEGATVKLFEAQNNDEILRFYRHGDRVLMTGTRVPEQTAAAIVRGEASASPLAASSSAPLGKRAAATEVDHAFYVNVKNALAHAPMLQSAAPPELAESLPDELVLTARPTSTGLMVRGEVDRMVLFDAFLAEIAMEQRRSKVYEAERTLQLMADCARTYFYSEQKFGTDREPWHVATAQNPVGFPVPWAQYTFPGGPEQTLTTHATVPRVGEPQPVKIEATRHAQATLDLLCFDASSGALPFRYTYETGAGGGEKATAVIRAEIDFDPGYAENHTMEVRIDVDPSTQEIMVTPLMTMHSWR